jgi:hypothetical protein
MDIFVVVLFLLHNGGSVEVKRYYPASAVEHTLNNETCLMLAYDVKHEMLGGPTPPLVADAIREEVYDCNWMI